MCKLPRWLYFISNSCYFVIPSRNYLHNQTPENAYWSYIYQILGYTYVNKTPWVWWHSKRTLWNWRLILPLSYHQASWILSSGDWLTWSSQPSGLWQTHLQLAFSLICPLSHFIVTVSTRVEGFLGWSHKEVLLPRVSHYTWIDDFQDIKI